MAQYCSFLRFVFMTTDDNTINIHILMISISRDSIKSYRNASETLGSWVENDLHYIHYKNEAQF